jgi:MFS transporter, FHS family, Na+ dependent glucose transporter 1
MAINWLRLGQTLIFGIGYLHMGLALGALGPTIQPLASQLGASISDMGWMFASRGVGALFGSLLLGKMYDLGAPCISFAASVLLMALALYIVALLPAFAMVVVAHFLMGVGVGCSDTGGNALLVWLWEGDSMLGAAMQFLHACFGAGAVFVALVAANLSLQATYNLMALSVGLSALLCIAIATIPIRAPKSTDDAIVVDEPVSQSVDRQAQHEMSDAAIATGSSSNDHALSMSAAARSNDRKRRETQVVFLISLQLLLLVGIEVAFGGMIGVYSTRMLGMSETDAAYVTSVFWFSFTFARIASIFIVMVVNESRMITLNTIGCVLSTLALAVLPYQPAALWVCCVGFGVSVASMFPSCMSLASILGFTLSGSSTRYLVFGASIGELTIPWITAILVDNVSPRSLPLVTALAVVCVYGIFLVLTLVVATGNKTLVIESSSTSIVIEMQSVESQLHDEQQQDQEQV